MCCRRFSIFHENVIGTSLELRVSAGSESAAIQAEHAALLEIERLSAILSLYDRSSEFARFCNLPIGSAVRISPELLEVLQRCDDWSNVSDGAFNVGAEDLINTWRDAERCNEMPDRKQLDASIERANSPHWSLNTEQHTSTRLSDASLSLNAIAKGVTLVAVRGKVHHNVSQVNGLMLNIGGDIRVAGELNQVVSIANPASDAIGSLALKSIIVTEGAVATSGATVPYWECTLFTHHQP